MAVDFCVVVADGTRARFFALQKPDSAAQTINPRLIEIEDLINTELEVPAPSDWPNLKSSALSTGDGDTVPQGDNYRHEQREQRFSKRIAPEAVRIAMEQKAKHLVLVAATPLLGMLKKKISAPPHSGLLILDLAKDFSKFSTREIEQHLADEKIFPQNQRPNM